MGDITSILYELGEDVPLPESVKQRIAELEKQLAEARAENERKSDLLKAMMSWEVKAREALNKAQALTASEYGEGREG